MYRLPSKGMKTGASGIDRRSGITARAINATAIWFAVASWALIVAAAILVALPAAASVKSSSEYRLKVNDRKEIRCLALNIYHEARGESDAGKLAVGHVVMNRSSDRRFPSTVCDVVGQGGAKPLHKCQFSWWCDGRSDKPTDWQSWYKSQDFARRIYVGISTDPTRGALWYHAEYVEPHWKDSLRRGPKIGQHIFYFRNTRRKLRRFSGSTDTGTQTAINATADRDAGSRPTFGWIMSVPKKPLEGPRR